MKNYIGKLVVLSHWSDFDLNDEVRLGILDRVEGNYFYISGSNRGYRYCRSVGKAIKIKENTEYKCTYPNPDKRDDEKV